MAALYYRVTMTTPTDRIAAESKVGSLKAAEDLAKLFQRSGYHAVIYGVDQHGRSVRVGDIRKPTARQG